MNRKPKAARGGVTAAMLASSLRLRPEGLQGFLDDHGMTAGDLLARMTDLRFQPADVAVAICGEPGNPFARELAA